MFPNPQLSVTLLAMLLAPGTFLQLDGQDPMPYLVIGLLLGALLLAGLLLLLVRRRYRLRQAEMVRRVNEMEALREAGRAIVASQQQLEDLCELIAAEAAKVIDTRTFQIGLFRNSYYQIIYWCVDGERRLPQTFDLGDDGGLIGWVRTRREPLLIHDFERELDALPARPRYISDNPPRSGLFVPLVSGDETLGVIAAQSSEPEHFSNDDLRRLTILANQAAAGIANARLFEQERTRAAQLELVGQIAQKVNAIQELDELFSEVVQLTVDIFGFHPVSIFGIDSQTGDVVILASSIETVEPGQAHLPAGLGLIGTAVSTRQTIVSNYTLEDERFVHMLEGGPEAATRAEIVVPLIVDDRLLGVLDVQSPEAGVFHAGEQTVLEALAAQVAIAIHKTQQMAAQREQAWVTTAQLQVADAIRQSGNMEELLAAVTRLTPMLVGVDHCAVLLWNEDLQQYEGAAVYGLADEQAETFLNSGLPIGAWPPLDAVHVGMVRLNTERLPPWLRGYAESCRLLLYPLIAKGHILGVMVVDEPAKPDVVLRGFIGEETLTRQDELLRSIANQTAQAIESEQLHLAQQEEAWVNTALLQVAEAVNSLIDLNEILNTIVRFIPMLVGVESCLILTWDEENDVFHAGPSYGLDEMGQGLLESFEITPAELPQLELERHHPLTPSAVVYRVTLPAWLSDLLNTRTAHALPLYARNRLVGALVVGPSTSKRPLIGRRLNILTGIAQQAAIAVVNDQLYREAAERSRLEQELDVARQIQASFIPPGSPAIPGCSVASFWQAARQVSGDFYDFLELAPDRWGIVVADVADKGVPAALFMALSRTVLRTIAFNRRDPGTTLERANSIIWNDTTSDLFVTAFYANWEPHKARLSYANAGHNPPLVMRRSGETLLLRGDGIALGVLDRVKIEQRELILEPGDTVIFYTDGVTEATNEDYDEFGLERLRMAAATAQDHDAAGIVRAITAAISDFAGDTPQFDDVTLVVMKRHS
ncbi:MAG: SpoIIE family protein phosphatase [Anaerolineae bacterium]|nr:SpoIIE family protein phosphatase [Anaerolineae bacterium]